MSAGTTPFNSRAAIAARNKALSVSDSRFYTTDDVAELLDVSSRSVWRWIKSHELLVHRFGRAVRIRDADLKTFIAACRESKTQ